VVCSTAVRARQTWELVAGTLGGEPRVTYDPRLYAAEPEALLGVVAEEPADTATLLLVGHVPGVAGLTLGLAADADGDALDRARAKFPTCAIAVLAVPGTWAELRPGTARLTAFATPRRDF